MDDRRAYTLREVDDLGFEARCVGSDGARYLWHDGCGLRVDRHNCMTTLVIDSSLLPAGPWFPTSFGCEQLAERQSVDALEPSGAT